MTARGYGVAAGVLLLVTFLAIAPVSSADGAAFDADPARCNVEPRTLDELGRILSLATPTTPGERPETGNPVHPDSESGRAVIATIETLFACLNAGDRLRAYALYTDGYLATILQPADLSTVATPYPNDPDELTRIVDITLRSLPGECIAANVVLDPALIPVDKIFEFILVPVEGQWKIDAVINEIDFSLP
jgi:hypothetical protein